MKNMIAFDCGNSSFRVILGRYDGKKIEAEVVEQIPNEMVKVHEYFYWDILMIYQKLIKGLKKAARIVERIDSIGICTWGVDFALFSKEGIMLNNPCSYRNKHGEKILNSISEEDQKKMFYETGILCDKINSVFLLKAFSDNMNTLVSQTDKLLMLPDILNYMFTGRMVNEPSELSTSQMMNVKTRRISHNICKMLEIPESFFSEIGIHGTKIGMITQGIKEAVEIDYDIPVVCVPSHDTASAVMAIPLNESTAFISSGTWSLIGTELDEPVLTEEVVTSQLTNEVGAFNKIMLLKNSAGMFFVHKLINEYEEEKNCRINWEEFNALGDQIEENIPVFHVNSNAFFNPGRMSKAIWNYLLDTKQVEGSMNWYVIVKSFQVSMACSYAVTIQRIEKICKKKMHSVYIVGGGSQNKRLCQLAANYTGKTVFTGGKESTSLGNIAAQIKYFEPEKSIEDIRKITSNSVVSFIYKSQKTDLTVLEKYEQLLP